LLGTLTSRMALTPRHPAYSQYRIERNTSLSPSQHLESDDSLELDATLDKQILAINYKNKYLGGAYWKSDENVLVVLADIQCANVIDMLDLGPFNFFNVDD
jgi:hypothetical protein